MLCDICGQETMAAGPDVPCCVFCYFTGRYFESVLNSDERANLLSRIRSIDQVRRAAVWHAGSGMFTVMIALADGRLVTPGIPYEMAGVKTVASAIPMAGEQWGVCVVSSYENEEADVAILPDQVDDEGLVATVEQLATLQVSWDGGDEVQP